MGLNFNSAFRFYRVRTDNVWTLDIPAIALNCRVSADDLSGVYRIDYPNPKGFAKSKFTHFQKQEIHIADPQTMSLIHVFTGQINNLDETAEKNILKIDGRGLSGILTDRKVNDSWTDKRVDFIVADPTFGIIPQAFGTSVTTWNAFTDYFTRFDFWDAAYWGAQPAYANIFNGKLELQGAGGSTRTIQGTSPYSYETFETSVKVDTPANTMRIGFANAALTEFAWFELTSTGINTVTKKAGATTTNAVTSPPSQTSFHFLRVEWAVDEARFFIDGTLTNTHTTNVPTSQMYSTFQVDNNNSLLTSEYTKDIILTRKIPHFIAKNKIMSDVMTDLCDTGTATNPFTFFIDKDFDFNATVIESLPSGYSFGYFSSIYTSKDQQITELKLTQEAKDLYNVVKIQGGENLTTVNSPSYTETQQGDGVTQSFILGFKARKPMKEVKIGAAVQTEGTNFDMIYAKENTVLKFSNVTPGAGVTVSLRYDFLKPIIASAENTASILQYGVRREYVKVDASIIDQTRANQLSTALLAFFSDPRTVIKVKVSIRPKLQIGQTVQIDAPFLNINNTTYEIIEMEHNISLNSATTTLTLANADIDTNAEIIREILQQLKEIREQGDTNATVVQEQSINETLKITESMTATNSFAADSFILGHPGDNGKLGWGIILDNLDTSVVANWTGTGFTVAAATTPVIVGTGSMSLTNAAAGTFQVATTQSFGDVSTYTGAANGAPTKGGLGVWIYFNAATDFTSGTVRFGSSSANYAQCNLVLNGTDNIVRAGWNYFVAYLDAGAITGTPNWLAASYMRFDIVMANAATIFMDYVTVSQSSLASPTRIGLNGLGRRSMQGTASNVVFI
jgi:hypothetical protein